MFNKGWLCPECGPVKESKKRSINKTKYDCCKLCGNIVKLWERPLNERVGHCGNCGQASFRLAIVKHQLIRNCKYCNEVYNLDTQKVLREGEANKKYERKDEK